MRLDFADLLEIPEFQALVSQQGQLRAEVASLRAQLPDWVDQVEAERLTGLSETTLWRERQNPHSLIKWKSDRGVRYDRASLLAHNASRTITRSRTPRL